MIKKVDFLFIGPSKTASTWIYKALKEHPEFSLPNVKDIYYFDKYYQNGEGWYSDFFHDCSSDKFTGEFSHDYIYQSLALDRIYSYNSEIRLIVCLRNPYERTLSGIKFLNRNGLGYEDLDELLSKHNELILGSLYGKNLKKVYQNFRRDQVLILDFSTLEQDPYKFLDDIYLFFGVSAFYPAFIEKKVNQAKAPRNRHISLMAKKITLILRKMGFAKLITNLKTNELINKILFKGINNLRRFTKDEYKILSKYFDADIDEFSKLTGKDYSEWKRK